MDKDEFNQLVADAGLDPRTLKRNGIEPEKEHDVIVLATDENRIALAQQYERDAAAKIRAARALRGVVPFTDTPAQTQTIMQGLLSGWTGADND